MKEMLFSSWGFCAPIMRSKFAKVIAQGEGLLEKTCLVIPYAGFDPLKTFEREKDGLESFGFSGQKIRLAEGQRDITAQRPDYIYVPGGDPFRLLKEIRERDLTDGIRDAVENQHAVYIGVSAGADIATPDIRYVTSLEDNHVLTDDFTALSLVSDSLFCHFDHYFDADAYLLLKDCEKKGERPVRTIKEDQLLQYKNGNWNYIGETI